MCVCVREWAGWKCTSRSSTGASVVQKSSLRWSWRRRRVSSSSGVIRTVTRKESHDAQRRGGRLAATCVQTERSANNRTLRQTSDVVFVDQQHKRSLVPRDRNDLSNAQVHSLFRRRGRENDNCVRWKLTTTLVLRCLCTRGKIRTALQAELCWCDCV